MKPKVENVQSCPLCGATVDRYEHHLECRNCKAVGDLVVGLFTPPVDRQLRDLGRDQAPTLPGLD